MVSTESHGAEAVHSSFASAAPPAGAEEGEGPGEAWEEGEGVVPRLAGETCLVPPTPPPPPPTLLSPSSEADTDDGVDPKGREEEDEVDEKGDRSTPGRLPPPPILDGEGVVASPTTSSSIKELVESTEEELERGEYPRCGGGGGGGGGPPLFPRGPPRAECGSSIRFIVFVLVMLVGLIQCRLLLLL